MPGDQELEDGDDMDGTPEDLEDVPESTLPPLSRKPAPASCCSICDPLNHLVPGSHDARN